MLTQIRWRRVVLAAFLSEVGVIASIFAVMTIYSRAFMPNITDAQYQALGERVGYYVAPAAGALTTFLMVLWVGRGLESGHVANGVMVGVVSVILTSGFFFMARPEDRLMYGVAFALRIVAGYIGGLGARKRIGSLDARRPGPKGLGPQSKPEGLPYH